MIKRLLPTAAVIAAALFAVVFAPDAAWAANAGRRVALVIGNSTYQTVPQLPNPSRDANSVAKMFRDAGFDSVDLALNVGNLEFKRAIRKFEATADQAEMAVVFYAGHGIEIGATNYLIPVDARLASDRDADDEAISLERLVSSADGASRLRLIILDACRDNPFVGTMRRERKVASRGVNAGLGKVEPTSSDTLIAYAAKAGSTADDGDGEHSPFTAAILKDLTVPGLDVRLAFGRVRDDVLKSTGSRQEPFVYGSLGGGNVSLVPAPERPQEAPVTDIKADYELVQRIGTKRAWEVFLGTHPTGFYAELAKAQIERISQPVVASVAPTAGVPAAPAAPSTPNTTVAALPPEQKPPNRESSSKEAVEWDKVRDATDPAALQKFIKRFPDSPLALNAQQRIDLLKKAQAERDEQARQAAEQARQAAEQARQAAEEAQRKAAEAAAQKKREEAELAAQKKREEDARRAAEAEAAEKAKAAAAALAAQKKREDDERRAAAAEAERQAKAAEAARKAQEAQQKAEQAEREKAAAVAAAAAAAAEKQAKEAEAARKKAELAAQKEATCKDEQGKLEAILTKGSEGTGVDDLKAFSKTVTCDRLGPVVVAAIDRFNAEVVKRAAVAPNSPQLVTSAQNELIRLGCMTGKADGTLNPVTTSALTRYLTIEGQPIDKPVVTKDLVTELSKHTTRVCPIECRSGETLKGEICVADKPAEPAPATASRKSDDEDDTPRRKQAKTQADRDQSRRQKPAAAPEAPHARAQALARPSIVSGGGGGGGGGGAHTMIGVGF
jgi:hypothetical protein